MTDTEYSNEPPFLFDPVADAARHARDMEQHENDLTMPWPLERLREFLPFADQLVGGAWQHVSVRLADIRATFTHIGKLNIQLGDLNRQVREARMLAETLYAFECRGADWPNVLDEFNPDLKHELLPAWLTGEPNGPQEWQTPHANAEAEHEAGMDATYEHDPDLGKDLDYDDEGPDEDERTTDADYEVYDGDEEN
jgi:hypothetical protein